MWTTPKDFKAQLVRLWERGELLRDAVTGNSRFPLRLSMKSPGSRDITERFDSVRNWTAELVNTPRLRIEWEDVRHRVQGLQTVPCGVFIDSLDDALELISKRRDWNRFLNLLEMTRQQNSLLLPWLEKRPLRALELQAEWQHLLDVVAWFKTHPRPEIYLRQVDVPGVHSKFIEAHRPVLSELLDLILPPETVDFSKTGVVQFTARYGFLEKPARIRFRILDPEIQPLFGIACPDISLDADSFSRLNIQVRRVFVTENETNFLTLPNVEGAIAIFGAGYGWDALARARWLKDCAVFYWGDIDTHGFAILDQFRGFFAHAESLLMDRRTLDAHQSFWGREDKPQKGNLLRLTPAELFLYNQLRENSIREGLRLEQEHVGFGWVCEAIEALLSENLSNEK